jgi:hypothetical protein
LKQQGEKSVPPPITLLTELYCLIRSSQSLIKLSDNPSPHITYNIKAEADGVKHAQNHNDYKLHEQQMIKYSILKLVICSSDECVSTK